MNYSEENPKHAGFNDIDVNENPFQPVFVPVIETPAYKAPSVEFSPSYQTPPGGISTNSNLEVIEMHSRLVKWTSLVLSIFSFLFLLPGTIPLIVTFIFPILGFIGAHKYNALIAKFYTVYLVLITIEQIIVMGIFPNPAYIVLQCFVMVAEIIVLLYNIKFTKEILILSDLDLLTLKTGKTS